MGLLGHLLGHLLAGLFALPSLRPPGDRAPFPTALGGPLLGAGGGDLGDVLPRGVLGQNGDGGLGLPVHHYVVPPGELPALSPLHARGLGDKPKPEVPSPGGRPVVLTPPVEEPILIGEGAIALLPVLEGEDLEHGAPLGHEDEEDCLEPVWRQQNVRVPEEL
eukprot:CAMPEP_0172606900 /NCGR_PEP_ID=MMETSP1068-20121228/27113_1 /TAXON_ID=35684 /ORGANISM="Pseudopedinella elastica, Strain CCMP716" /LENGTH=162 /DNA_ID=CAMNT_0013409771 /DNA_START=287 /DNA_END=775 /DNA_ORIENTATION=+